MRISWLGSAVIFAACFHGGSTVPVMRNAALDLARAREQFHRGDFREAVVLLQRAQFELGPAEREVAEVHYLIAECDFQVGDRATAALEFRKLADEFPNSEYAPLALLRAGDAHLRLWRRPELDPTPAQAALASYQELQARYPETEAAARARGHVRQLNEWFSEKDYKNGMFYFRRKAYDSGIIYFKDIIANYPDTPRVPDALMRLVDSYRAIRYTDELKEACASLRRYYPHADGLDRRCPPDQGAGTP